MERFGSGTSFVSEGNVMLPVKRKTSFYPVTTQVGSLTPLTKINMCNCGGRPVTLYCRKHDTLLCKSCKYRDHVRCHVEKLEHVARGILESRELNVTVRELTVLKNVFQKMNENERLKKLQHRQEKNSMVKLSKRWNMLQSTRTTLKKGVEQRMDKCETEIDAREKVTVRKSRWVFHRVNDYLTELGESIEKEKELDIYLVLHHARKDLQTFRNILTEITQDKDNGNIFEEVRTMVTGIYFCENQGSVRLARALKPNLIISKTNMEEIDRKSTPSERSKSSHSFRRRSRLSSAGQRFRPAFRPQTIRMATLLSSLRSGRSSRTLTKSRTSLTKNPLIDRPSKEFTMYPSSERHPECQISAMCPLHDGKLLVVDCRNDMLKLFSPKDVVLSELYLGCSIWDLATFSKSEILITCPGEGKLQRVTITRDNQLAKTGYILTQKECRALNCVANRIYISYCGEKPCIKILSKDGIMFRSIEATKGRITLFKNPLYMHVTKLGKLMYVSDFSLQRVAKIDQKGNLLGIIDVNPGWPLDLSMTREENLFVAVSGTSDIKMIPRGSSKCLALIETRAMDDGDPCVVMLKEPTVGRQPKQLYVAFSGSCSIKIFSIG